MNKIKNWFLHSETILWGRVQILLGIIWAVVSVTDLSPLLSPKWFAVWGIVNGVVTELLRRRNTEIVTQMVQEAPHAEPVQVEMLSRKPYPIVEGTIVQ
jgi:hypothetical protein